MEPQNSLQYALVQGTTRILGETGKAEEKGKRKFCLERSPPCRGKIRCSVGQEATRMGTFKSQMQIHTALHPNLRRLILLIRKTPFKKLGLSSVLPEGSFSQALYLPGITAGGAMALSQGARTLAHRESPSLGWWSSQAGGKIMWMFRLSQRGTEPDPELFWVSHFLSHAPSISFPLALSQKTQPSS